MPQPTGHSVVRGRIFPGVPLLAALLLTVSVRAQTPPASAADTAERVQREQQDREREQLRRARESARPPAELQVPLPAGPRAAPSGVKRDIRELVITGADHMAAKFRASLTPRYTGRLGVEDVERLLGDITRYYILRGYATTRAYLPEQDLSTGVLRVTVVEGRIERIDGAGVSGNLFPTHAGDWLNLRPLEQGIDNLNRLASNNAALDLQPGSRPGDTVVVVKNQPGRRWHVSASFDNTGSEGTGRDQASATLAIDNPLGRSDSLTLNYRRAVPYRAGEKASESTTVSYSVPWGWQLFTAGGTASSYALLAVAPSGFALPFDGRSRSVFLRAERLLYRGQSSRLNASATLTRRSSRNYLLGSLIGVSSRDTTMLDVGLDYSTAWHGAMVSAGTGLGCGLPWFGGLDDPAGLPDYAPHARYLKLLFNAGYSRAFTLSGLRLSFSSAFNGQYSPRVLYGTDQLTVGGLYAVRGFDQVNPAGDSGYVWRNDLSLLLAVPSPFGARFGAELGLRPYAGLDQGHAWSSVTGLPASFVPPHGSLAGTAGGLALTLGRTHVDFSYHRALARPAGIAREAGRFYVQAGTSF
ncbi:MAG TPA: ShlB/FhaC/HecB family hemolysin secretion/activation protein [Opitutus sp.]|nr:ShlB/FhaC/HecB family hemolysin secretion/activation protein [Opitutus sp.]